MQQPYITSGADNQMKNRNIDKDTKSMLLEEVKVKYDAMIYLGHEKP